MSTSRQGSATRRNRYARSSTTTSVTQMLSDSCSSLLQRLTTRVRGNSALNDAANSKTAAIRRSPNTNHLSTTRIRLEDKYSTILDKYSRKKRQDRVDRGSTDYRRTRERDHSYYHREDSPYVRDEKTLEPSMTRAVIKSPTSVVLSEKAYPYVKSSASKDFKREKTPGYHRSDRQTLLTSETYRRYGRHKSGHVETRTRKVRPYRNGKSEQLEPSSTALRLARPMKLDSMKERRNDRLDPDKTPTSSVARENDVQETVDDTDPAIVEREAKRKEIQSLIMKYAAMEDTYSQLAAGGQVKMRPSTADIIASKYRKDIHQSERKDAAKTAAVSAASVVNNADHAIVSCRTACVADICGPPGSRQCCYPLRRNRVRCCCCCVPTPFPPTLITRGCCSAASAIVNKPLALQLAAIFALRRSQPLQT